MECLNALLKTFCNILTLVLIAHRVWWSQDSNFQNPLAVNFAKEQSKLFQNGQFLTTCGESVNWFGTKRSLITTKPPTKILNKSLLKRFSNFSFIILLSMLSTTAFSYQLYLLSSALSCQSPFWQSPQQADSTLSKCPSTSKYCKKLLQQAYKFNIYSPFGKTIFQYVTTARTKTKSISKLAYQPLCKVTAYAAFPECA